MEASERVTVSTAQKRRGRGPSHAKTAETKRTLIAAALDVFLERGFSQTRMSDVAERAGLAKGTLYLHFEDKAALFEGVLREAIRDPFASAETLSPAPTESFRSLLVRIVVPVLRDLERSRRASVIRLVITEGARFPDLAAIYRRVVIDPLSALVRRLGQEAFDRGELRADALARFPLLLVAPGAVATLWNGLYGADEPMDTAAVFEAFLDLVFEPQIGAPTEVKRLNRPR